MLAEAWQNLAETLGRADYAEKARQIHARESSRITAYWKWKQSLRPSYRRYVSFRVGNLLSAFDSAPAPLSSAEREAADSASAR